MPDEIKPPDNGPNWSAEATKDGEPMAVLRAGQTLVAKIYLSPDQGTLRIVLPEMRGIGGAAGPPTLDHGQVKIDFAHKLIDFKRKL